MIECRLCNEDFELKEAAETPLMHSCIHAVKVCKKCDDRADAINKKRKLGIKHDPRWKGGTR